MIRPLLRLATLSLALLFVIVAPGLVHASTLSYWDYERGTLPKFDTSFFAIGGPYRLPDVLGWNQVLPSNPDWGVQRHSANQAPSFRVSIHVPLTPNRHFQNRGADRVFIDRNTQVVRFAGVFQGVFRTGDSQRMYVVRASTSQGAPSDPITLGVTPQGFQQVNAPPAPAPGVSPVPLPGSAWMLLSALAFGLFIRSRRA